MLLALRAAVTTRQPLILHPPSEPFETRPAVEALTPSLQPPADCLRSSRAPRRGVLSQAAPPEGKGKGPPSRLCAFVHPPARHRRKPMALAVGPLSHMQRREHVRDASE